MEFNIEETSPQRNGKKIEATKRAKVKERLTLERALSGTQLKALADRMHVDMAAVSRIFDPEKVDNLHAHNVPDITLEMGPGFMEWLAVQCGGVYLHGGEQAILDGSTTPALIGLLAHHSGATIQLLVEQFEDHVWTAEEKREAIPMLRKLRQVVDTLLADAEGGQP